MPRVTDADVKAILATTIDTTPFIYTASLLVTTQLAPFYSDAALLVEMERWWAAHLACARTPLVAEKTMGDLRLKYHQSKESLGLESTPYGQTLLSLDALGILAPTTDEVAAGIKLASFEVV